MKFIDNHITILCFFDKNLLYMTRHDRYDKLTINLHYVLLRLLCRQTGLIDENLHRN